MQLRRLAFLASLCVLASCGKETTGPGGIVTGSFSFNFAGSAINGTYTASGAFNAAQQQTVQWAAGEVVTADNETWAAAAVPVNSTTHNFAFVVANRTTTGTSTIVSSCSTNCAEMGLLYQANNTNFAQFAQSCFLTSGTITITTLSSTRAIGTFSGSGNCVTPTGVTTTFTVTNGTFDVPLVAGVA